MAWCVQFGSPALQARSLSPIVWLYFNRHCFADTLRLLQKARRQAPDPFSIIEPLPKAPWTMHQEVPVAVAVKKLQSYRDSRLWRVVHCAGALRLERSGLEQVCAVAV